jgi:uncharacterized circularly permuted ATP-grasp superfamily protein
MLTEEFARLGMDFKVKDESAGLYNRRHKVPIEPLIVPVKWNWVRDTIKTTQPYLQGCRRFLQAYFREPNPTVQSILGHMGLPASFEPMVRELLTIVKQSMYNLPRMHGQQMIDYPFLAGPVGFDAVVSSISKVEGLFFEPNLGTPSGLSNLTKKLEVMRRVDPEQFARIEKFMVENRTWEYFRQAIDGAAKKWTQVEGISVEIGPGEHNGAHPDVASISMFTGLPLVKPGDLYIGRDGFVYLRTASGNHPRVTGIYSRMEESFLLQEGDSPMIQTFVDNAALGRQIGMNLRPGVWYEYKFPNGDWTKPPIGVEVDAQGQAKIAQLYDRPIGRNPETGTIGSIREAILNRKLFVNNIGGRIIDDKAAFELFHSIGQQYKGDSQLPVAGPPRTLPRNRYNELYANPDERWVVKVTDASGGEGVYIFAGMTPQERTRIASEVQNAMQNPGGRNYVVQYFTVSGAMVTVRRNESGQPILTTKTLDWRFFPFFMADGQVEAGSAAGLFRVAPFGKGKANTSSGGGYGILVPIEQRPTQVSESAKFPKAKKQTILSLTNEAELQDFFTRFRKVSDSVERGDLRSMSREELQEFALSEARVMHLVGWEFSELRGVVQDYLQGQAPLQKVEAAVRQYAQITQRANAQNNPFNADKALEYAELAFRGYSPVATPIRGPTGSRQLPAMVNQSQ